jgi:release factor glutamine methyltransferase
MTASPTLAETLRAAAATLREAGAASPAFEARALIAGVLGLSREKMLAHPELPLATAARDRLADALTRRAGGEPLARITGLREFWSLPIALGPETLVPRPETETVVEAVLGLTPDRGRELAILDLGTGSGCILFALLSELPGARGLGIDLAEGALSVAGDNAERLGFSDRARFQAGDWGRGLKGPFDIIVANPPYIAAPERTRLAPEVRDFDPVLALDGGADGLAAYLRLGPDIARLLADDGIAVLELGAGQAVSVARIFKESGLVAGPALRDLGGRRRALPLARRAARLEAGKMKKKVGNGAVPV